MKTRRQQAGPDAWVTGRKADHGMSKSAQPFEEVGRATPISQARSCLHRRNCASASPSPRISAGWPRPDPGRTKRALRHGRRRGRQTQAAPRLVLEEDEHPPRRIKPPRLRKRAIAGSSEIHWCGFKYACRAGLIRTPPGPRPAIGGRWAHGQKPARGRCRRRRDRPKTSRRCRPSRSCRSAQELSRRVASDAPATAR